MEALQGGGQITPITTIKRHRAAAGRVRHRPRSLKTAGGRSPLIIKDLDLYPQPPTNTRSPTLNSEEPLYPTTRPRGDRGLRRSRGFLLRQRRRRSPQQVLQTRTRMVRRPLEGTRRPRQPRPPDGWTGTTAPASPTTTTSHPRPPNTATIATTPPHPPPYNQPSTKPGTIQTPDIGPPPHQLCRNPACTGNVRHAVR